MKSLIVLFVLVGCGPRRFEVLPQNAPWAGGTFDAGLCPAPAPPLNRCKDNMPAAALQICGTLETDNTLTVEPRQDADLLVAGDWHSSAPVSVAGGADVSGTLTHDNTVSVGGTLAVAAESGSGALQTGATVVGPVTSPLACGQAASNANFVSDSAQHHDDVLPRFALANISEPTELTLGCGRYFLDSITANNTLDLHIAGPTTLVIEGDVTIAAPMRVDLETAGAELDFVIGGALQINNTLSVGSSAHPVWMSVAGEIRVASPANIFGVLVAPTSALQGDNTLDVFGAAMVGATRVASPMNVHDGVLLTADGCLQN